MIQLICPFCDRILSRKNGHTSHVKSCRLNPLRLAGKNHFTKAKENGTVFIVADSTLEKIRINNKGRSHTELSREKMSVSMKLSVLNNPESYRGKYNRGFIKQIKCSNGFTVLGTWEQAFVEFCLTNSIAIKQPDYSFSYEHEGLRSYFPDFYLPEYNLYVEVKGFKTDKDVAKWDSIKNNHRERLLIIDKRIIKEIQNNSTTINYLMENFIY